MSRVTPGHRSTRVAQLRAVVIAVILAVAALTALGPTAASAYGDDVYVAPASVSISPATVHPGGRATITFEVGFFEADESVATAVRGARSGEALVVPDSGSGSLAAQTDGSLTVAFVAPAQGYGTYVITFSASREYTAVVTVVGHAAAGHTGSAPLAPDLNPGSTDFSAGSEALAPDLSTPLSPDREGRVKIPSEQPEASAWPRLDIIPWGLAILGAVALIACTVTVALVIAARRRR